MPRQRMPRPEDARQKRKWPETEDARQRMPRQRMQKTRRRTRPPMPNLSRKKLARRGFEKPTPRTLSGEADSQAAPSGFEERKGFANYFFKRDNVNPIN